MIEDLHIIAQLIIVTLAVARVTQLVTDDVILDDVRGRLLARLEDHDKLSYLVTCPKCAGFWVTVLWVGAWAIWPIGTTIAALPWAVAAAALTVNLLWVEE